MHNAAKLFETARRIDKLDLGKDFSISGQTRTNTVAAVLTAFSNRIRALIESTLQLGKNGKMKSNRIGT